MSDAARAAKRRYYHRNRERILRQQAEYRRRKRHNPSLKARLADNTQRWRGRFKDTMRNQGHAGRTGQGLSPEGYRWRDQRGLPVPPWPTLVEPRKQRRRLDLPPWPGQVAEIQVDSTDDLERYSGEEDSAHPMRSAALLATMVVLAGCADLVDGADDNATNDSPENGTQRRLGQNTTLPTNISENKEPVYVDLEGLRLDANFSDSGETHSVTAEVRNEGNRTYTLKAACKPWRNEIRMAGGPKIFPDPSAQTCSGGSRRDFTPGDVETFEAQWNETTWNYGKESLEPVGTGSFEWTVRFRIATSPDEFAYSINASHPIDVHYPQARQTRQESADAPGIVVNSFLINDGSLNVLTAEAENEGNTT